MTGYCSRCFETACICDESFDDRPFMTTPPTQDKRQALRNKIAEDIRSVDRIFAPSERLALIFADAAIKAYEEFMQGAEK